MKCYSETFIQKYIDGELPIKDASQFEVHSIDCQMCARNLDIQQKRTRAFKSIINTMASDEVDVPTFSVPVLKCKSKFSRYQSLISIVAAAAVIIVALIFSPFFCENNNVIVVQNITDEVDANKPISEQQLSILVVDPSGKAETFYLE